MFFIVKEKVYILSKIDFTFPYLCNEALLVTASFWGFVHLPRSLTRSLLSLKMARQIPVKNLPVRSSFGHIESYSLWVELMGAFHAFSLFPRLS